MVLSGVTVVVIGTVPRFLHMVSGIGKMFVAVKVDLTLNIRIEDFVSNIYCKIFMSIIIRSFPVLISMEPGN